MELIAIVDRAFYEIIDAPLSHALWRDDRTLPSEVLTRFPYVVFLRAESDIVEIIAVANAKRRPGYWLERERRGT